MKRITYCYRADACEELAGSFDTEEEALAHAKVMMDDFELVKVEVIALYKRVEEHREVPFPSEEEPKS